MCSYVIEQLSRQSSLHESSMTFYIFSTTTKRLHAQMSLKIQTVALTCWAIIHYIGQSIHSALKERRRAGEGGQGRSCLPLEFPRFTFSPPSLVLPPLLPSFPHSSSFRPRKCRLSSHHLCGIQQDRIVIFKFLATRRNLFSTFTNPGSDRGD